MPVTPRAYCGKPDGRKMGYRLPKNFKRNKKIN